MSKPTLKVQRKSLTEKQVLRRKGQIEVKIAKLSAKLVKLFS